MENVIVAKFMPEVFKNHTNTIRIFILILLHVLLIEFDYPYYYDY